MGFLTPEFVQTFSHIFPRAFLGFFIAGMVVVFMRLVIALLRDLHAQWQVEQAKAQVRQHTAVVAFDLMLEREQVRRQMQAIVSSAPRPKPD